MGVRVTDDSVKVLHKRDVLACEVNIAGSTTAFPGSTEAFRCRHVKNRKNVGKNDSSPNDKAIELLKRSREQVS